MRYFRIIAVFAIICLIFQDVAHAQFKYLGMEIEVTGTPAGGFFAPSLSYIHQFSTHHAWGVDVSVPITLRIDRSLDYATDDYDLNIIYMRQQTPTIGVRYRLFLGNSPFIGLHLQTGLINDRFRADRLWTPNISAAYASYDIWSPHFRLQSEFGLITNRESTFPKIESFGIYDMGYWTMEPKPAKGVSFIGGATATFGIKI